MYLAQLKVSNFRKLQKVELSFEPGLNTGRVQQRRQDRRRRRTARITIRYSEADKTGRLRAKRWCGDHEDVGLTTDMMENLRSVYLPPLRHASQGLKPNRTSQLSRLFQLLADEAGREGINKALKQFDEELKKHEPVGNKLARRGLPSTPLITAADLAGNDDVARIRVDTVHQAKGESLDAVLYLANREHANALLAGVDTEVGRIGYVAVTRARNLFWLGVPVHALEELRPALLARGFLEAGAAAPA